MSLVLRLGSCGVELIVSCPLFNTSTSFMILSTSILFLDIGQTTISSPDRRGPFSDPKQWLTTLSEIRGVYSGKQPQPSSTAPDFNWSYLRKAQSCSCHPIRESISKRDTAWSFPLVALKCMELSLSSSSPNWWKLHWNHYDRIIEWLRLEGTSGDHLV